MNLETYILTSDYSAKPLAAMRVVGDKYEILEDNSDGQVERLARGSFRRLCLAVDKSSHLKLAKDDRPVPQYHRYMLNNGDVAEITTDGLTVLLNGELLNEEEKQTLLNMLASNQLTVRHGRDDQQAHTVMPKIKAAPKEEKPLTSRLNPGLMDGIRADRNAQKLLDDQSSVHYDPRIENAEFDTLDPSFTKTLAYGLKYGKFKGGSDA